MSIQWNFLEDDEFDDTFVEENDFDDEGFNDSEEEDFEKIVSRLAEEDEDSEEEECAKEENGESYDFDKMVEGLNAGIKPPKRLSEAEFRILMKKMRKEQELHKENPFQMPEETDEKDFDLLLEEVKTLNVDDLIMKAICYREKDIDKAIQILEVGHGQDMHNTRYLVMLMEYNLARKNYEELYRYREYLETIPFEHWSGSTFRSLIRVLMEEDAAVNEAETRRFIDEYARNFPFEEFSGWHLYELEMELGNRSAAVEALKATIKRVPNAPLCCEKLSQIQMENGQFEEARATIICSLAASCQHYKTIPRMIQAFRLVKCEEALMWQRMAEKGEPPSALEIKRLCKSYQKFIDAREHTFCFNTKGDHTGSMLLFDIRLELKPIIKSAYESRNLLRAMHALYK